MTKYRTYEQAYRRGASDVWPGCGARGRCMPCNRLHNYDYRSHVNGPVVDDYRCGRNYRSGCPQPKPKPQHDFNRQGRCRRCGTPAPPLQYRTIAGTLIRTDGVLSWQCSECRAEGTSKQVRKTCPECCR